MDLVKVSMSVIHLNLDFKGFGHKHHEKRHKMESEFFDKDGRLHLS